MKRLFSISSVSIALLLIMAFSIVPHHHHVVKEVWCMEMCTEEIAHNDRNTTHDSPEKEPHHDSNCVTKAQYTAPSKVLKGNPVFEDGDNLYLFNCVSLLISYIVFSPEYSIIQTASFRDVVPYESAPLGLCCGLRAPPYSLS